jgi:CDP-diglyceride synthetase
MRQRAITAIVLVPVLLIVLVVGGPLLVAGIAAITAFAGIEVFRLLRSAGYPTFALLGTALAIVVVLDAAIPTVSGSGPLLIAVGIVLVAVA